MISNKVEEALDSFGAQLEEFLSCYVLIGYELNGERIRSYKIMNTKDQHALVELMRNNIKEWEAPKNVISFNEEEG